MIILALNNNHSHKYQITNLSMICIAITRFKMDDPDLYLYHHKRYFLNQNHKDENKNIKKEEFLHMYLCSNISLLQATHWI